MSTRVALLSGRRYSEGLHQAIEAKEGVQIKAENQTYASITLQNYFRQYDKLAGMTGTAQTEAAELNATYGMNVIPIPTHKPMIRMDQSDLLFKSEQAKYNAIIEDVLERHKNGQPMLIGTVSVEKSEQLSKELRKHGIQHKVLNAKQHDDEAAVVAEAGRKGAVTVATNMAGRGTDIMLGGNPEFRAVQEMHDAASTRTTSPRSTSACGTTVFAQATKDVAAEHEEVLAAGGLYVLGTERHESRRIDNQLRGRSGRQGDPGESRFYLSLEDDLMRMFQSGLAATMMNSGGASGRPADRVEDADARRAQRAGADRGPQRRDPQEHPQVRRRRVVAAHDHLRRAPPHPEWREPSRRGARLR